MYGQLYPLLFKYVFGENEDFPGDYYWALTLNNLRKRTKYGLKRWRF